MGQNFYFLSEVFFFTREPRSVAESRSGFVVDVLVVLVKSLSKIGLIACGG